MDTPGPGFRERSSQFFETYTRDLTRGDFRRLFTRDTQEAYRFFSRELESPELNALPGHRRLFERAKQFFLAFTLRLSPARRAVYGASLIAAVLGLLQAFRGLGVMKVPAGLFSLPVPAPVWADGSLLLAVSVVLLNLLILLEVADRLSLKHDLEVARGIQQAMLHQGVYSAPGAEVYGLTRPANTVGGDFYEILPRADGRLLVAVGDVAGKGSPAALLMALLLAALRTIVDEELDIGHMTERLNRLIMRHAPPSRFITLLLASYDPATGDIEYVNAGHLPGVVQGSGDEFGLLTDGGVALGLFEGSTYAAGRAVLEGGDTLVLYSDGITEAENALGRPFDDSGLKSVLAATAGSAVQAVGEAVLSAVERHVGEARFRDDLTIVVLRRPRTGRDGSVVGGAPA